jgi:hypothetical protein
VRLQARPCNGGQNGPPEAIVLRSCWIEAQVGDAPQAKVVPWAAPSPARSHHAASDFAPKCDLDQRSAERAEQGIALQSRLRQSTSPQRVTITMSTSTHVPPFVG